MNCKSIFGIMILAFALSACHARKQPSVENRTVILPALGTTSEDTLTVNANAEFWLEHVIENGDSVYAVAARLHYDTSFVKVLFALDGSVQAENGGYLGGTGHLTVSLINGMAGNLLMAYSKQGEQSGTSGNGLLWRVRMRALRSGNTELIFDKQKSAVLGSNFIGNAQERLPAEFVDAHLEMAAFSPMRVRLLIKP